MKLSLGVSAALAGLAAATAPTTDVYLLQSKTAAESSTDTPSLQPEIARLVFLQRLAPTSSGSLLDVAGEELEETVSYINQFGRSPQPLFSDAAPSQPSQLLLLLHGITDDSLRTIKQAMGNRNPAFHVADPQSSRKKGKRVSQDLSSAGVARTDCQFDEALNPLEEKCWRGKSSIAVFDVKENHSIVKSLSDSLARLERLAQNDEMDTILVLIPASSSGAGGPDTWAPSEELRRRQVTEEVMSGSADSSDSGDKSSDEDTPSASSSSSSGTFVFTPNGRNIPACFSSKDSCMTSTGNCSGHGECANKYAKEDGSSKGTCFACRCMSTTKDKGSVTHWAGPTCSKVDVSVPFWLFTGMTIGLITIVGFAISLLFNVGEEKLPGVIGAGVSKSK